MSLVIPDRDINGKAIVHPDAFASNGTADGKILYTKIHGMKADVAAGATHLFQFTVPYTEVYFQGAEILVDIVSVSNFTIKHPLDMANPLEQYGFNVNMGKIIYKKEGQYAAKIPQGLVLECEVTNDTNDQQEMGVNFVLHEIRDPAV